MEQSHGTKTRERVQVGGGCATVASRGVSGRGGAPAKALRCYFDVGGEFPYYGRTGNETPPIVDLDKDTNRTCTTVFEFLHSFTRNSLCLVPETLLR